MSARLSGHWKRRSTAPMRRALPSIPPSRWADAGWTNSAGSMIVNPGKFLASAVGSLTQPLFARGQVIASTDRPVPSRRRLPLPSSRHCRCRQRGERCLDCLADKPIQKRTAGQAGSFLADSCRSTSLLMEHGNTTYLEVLTARQTLLNAQLAQTANRFSEIQSLINLYKALGGGQE